MRALTPAKSGLAENPGRRPPSWLLHALLVGLVALAYWNSLQSPFLFDDLNAVQHNPTIRQLWPLTRVLTPPADGSATTGRPVVNLSFAINHAIGGESVAGYHAVNGLIHAAAALALLGLVRRTLASPAVGPRYQAAAEPLAFAAAAIWALHPLQTESVTCIAQRTEVLCGLFYLLVFYCFARAMPSPRARTWLILAVLSCWLGMATKEVMVTAPLLVLLYDRTFVAGSFAAAWRQRRGFYTGLASSWLLLAWLVMSGGGSRGTAAGFGLGVSWWNYLLKQCEAILLYLKLSVWPHPLVLDYGTAAVNSWTEVWWQGPAVLALLGGTIWALVRRPVAGFFGAWFFVILAPSSSVVPLVAQTMAEHRMYLPLAAVVCGFLAALYRWLEARSWLPLGAIALLLGFMTVVRNHDYRDATVIWTDTVKKCPRSARAHVNLGVELGKTGRETEALQHFARAIELQTDFVVSGHYHYGATCLDSGRLPEAIEHLETAVRLAPGHGDAQFTLGNAFYRAGRLDEAVARFTAALAIKPAADAHYNLGLALADLGREEEARTHFGAAIRLDPGMAKAHFKLAGALSRTGRNDEAASHFAEAVRLAPAQAEVHIDYGVFLARLGRLPEAIGHLREAVRLVPDRAEAHANLGNALLLQGQVSEAIAQYQEALRLRPDDSRTRENLSIAREALASTPP